MSLRCALCPATNVCIPPDGPKDADVLFIGEAPGKDEQKQALRNPPGRPFVGKTGDEVNRHYLPLAGLRRNHVLVTNAIRCLPATNGGKLDPKNKGHLALLESCAAHHLYPLLERLRPTARVIPLGAFAVRALGLDLTLDLHHGIPTQNAWGLPTFPMFHPAQGIHEPKKMLQIRGDWHRLGLWIKGCLPLREDGFIGNEDYQEVTDASELAALDPTRPLACDTESTRKRQPHCLTFSQDAGRGRLIRASRTDLLRGFQRHLDEWEADILFHNWLYDAPVTEALGLSFPVLRVVDTMARVFHLGNLPQGLKALAFRELGMVMDDFEDVVSPHSTQNVLIYYQIAQSYPWPKPPEELVIDEKTGLWKLYKPQSMNTKLKRFFTDYGKNADKNVFDMWTENWTASQAMIEEQCGEWPGMCISHVPFAKVLYYACRDVDALIRLWPVLTAMERQVRRTSQENWRVA